MTTAASSMLCRSILNLCGDALVAVDRENRVLFWNSMAEKLFGYPTESVVGEPLPSLVSAEDAEIEASYLRTVEEEHRVHFRGQRIGRTGKLFWARIEIHLLQEHEHGVSGFCYMVRPEPRPSQLSHAIERGRLERAHRLARLGFWELDAGTSEVFWSPELFKMFDLDPEQDRPLDLEEQSQVFTPSSWDAIQRALRRSLQTGEPYELELEYMVGSGRSRWMLARGEAHTDEDNQICGLCGTAIEITQLKETQLMLERSRERLSLAAAAAQFGVWDIDLSTGVLVWDELMHEHYGTCPETFGGRFEDWSRLVHPEDLPEAQAAFERALAGEEEFDILFRVCRPDGAEVYLGGKAIVHFQEGEAVRVVGVNWDLTEQHEAATALRTSENLLRDFVTHAPAAIAMLDRDLCYLQTSQRWLSDYGLEGEDLIGKSHYEVFPDQPVRWRKVHQRALEGSVEACSEDPFPRADGRCDWLQWEVRPWFDSLGEVGGVIFFTQVITERKEMELKLQEQHAELQRSNKDLEQFAYVASHDLQEPLRAVAGCAQILESRYGEHFDELGLEMVQHIVEGAERMKLLISNLLVYSRVSNGDNFRPLDSGRVLEEALDLLRVSIEESKAEIRHGKLPTVTGDRSQLCQLFQNIIGNAIKYRSERPLVIDIEVEEHEERWWRFTVADNGIGMEQKYFKKIFGIFQRLHTRTEYPGTGIGLALCKKIVRRHGGKLWVESSPGKGSRFSWTLPKGVKS